MDSKFKTIAVQAVGMILALGVGILIGGKACSETKTKVHREYMAPPARIKEVEKIVYQCPPEEVEERAEKTKIGEAKKAQKKAQSTEPKIVKSKRSQLPPEGPEAQNKRKRLLSFVRTKSKATLQGCRGSDKRVYRLSVSLTPRRDGSVSAVKISAPPGEVPAGILTCLRGRMKQWQLPKDDVVAKQPIVWGLTL